MPTISYRNNVQAQSDQMTKPALLRELANSALDTIGELINRSIIDPCRGFPAFTPNSSGAHSQRSELTIRAANNTFPCLGSLCGQHVSHDIRVVTPREFASLLSPDISQGFEKDIKRLLDKHGSEKLETTTIIMYMQQF